MSGAGSDDAGSSDAGAEEDPEVPAARNVRPPHALFLDLSKMDFPINDEGLYVEVHPVDHQVLMLIGPELGTVAAVPDQGLAWSSMPYDVETVMTRRADELVRNKLAALLSRGDIGELSVTYRSNVIGRGRVLVEYRNLREPNIQDQFRTVETN